MQCRRFFIGLHMFGVNDNEWQLSVKCAFIVDASPHYTYDKHLYRGKGGQMSHSAKLGPAIIANLIWTAVNQRK